MKPFARAAADAKRAGGRPRHKGDAPAPEPPRYEVTSVAVLPSAEEPAAALDGEPADA